MKCTHPKPRTSAVAGKRRGPKPQGSMPTWSANLAYVVGLIASDGCLSGDGRHIDITSTDVVLLKTALRILKKKNRIVPKKSGHGGAAFRIQLGDVILYDWLISIGLTPRKSLTLGPIAIPDIFFSDFVRGLWDGDGTVYSYFDPRWGTHMYYIAFATASRAFAEWLQGALFQLAHVSGHATEVTPRGHNTMHQLRYSKAESQRVFRWMFYSRNLPHLPRKFAKMQKILTIDAQQVDKRYKQNRVA
jgi:LAGLIDADG-like domain